VSDEKLRVTLEFDDPAEAAFWLGACAPGGNRVKLMEYATKDRYGVGGVAVITARVVGGVLGVLTDVAEQPAE